MKNLNKTLSVIVGIMALLFIAHFFSNAIETPALFLPVLAVLFALGMISRTKEGYAYDTVSPDLSAIAAYAGKYSKTLHKRLMQGLDFAKDVTAVLNVKHAITMANLLIENGPEPWTGDFRPNANDVGYNDRVLTVEAFQRDIEIKPGKYRTTYLAENRRAGEGADNLTIPFAQHTLESVIDHNASVLNNQTMFHGIGKGGFSPFNVATSYVGNGTEYITFAVGEKLKYFKVIAATTAGQTPVTHPLKFSNAGALAIAIGLGTKLKAGRAGGGIGSVSATGSLATDAYAKFTEVWRKWPEVYRQKGGIMYCSLDSYDSLLDDLEIDVSKYTTLDIALKHLPKTQKKCELKPVSWMSGSEMLVCTTKENLMYGTDLLGDVNLLKAIPTMYTVQLSITGVVGTQYQDGGIISMNDMN